MAIEDRPATRQIPGDRCTQGIQRTVRRQPPDEAAFGAADHRVIGVGEARGACHHGVHHRLEVGGGAGDHAQDLTRRCLLLQRLLRLIEQPHVLDGDDRLVGEGLEQADLLIRERDRLGPSELDGADRDAFADQGHAQYRAEA